MFYEYGVTIPKSKAETTPTTQDLRLAKGVIHKVHVQFPIGCAGLVHCRLTHHSFGELPTNPDGSFSSDGYIVSSESPLEFFKEPYIIKFIGWNEDDTYAHTVTVRFDIIESQAYIWLLSLFKGIEKMLKLVGIKV